MLQPKRTKYRKMQKGRVKGLAHRGNQVAFGTFGLKALEEAWLTAAQIEAMRVVLNRTMKRQGKVWITIFPDKPITKKPAEVRMGKGKGSPEGWVSIVKPGRVLCELDGVPLSMALDAMRLASHKLPIRTKVVLRRDYVNLEEEVR